MEKKSNLPTHYTILLPNAITEASKDSLSPIEMRLYHEILAQNHLISNDQLVYQISYDILFEGRNVKRKKEEIINIQKRSFFFSSGFMQKYFGKNAEASIVPVPKILFLEDDKTIEVYLEPTFKKILTLIDKNLDVVEQKGIPYTKGSVEDLRTFTGWFTHKFYWLLREEQDKTRVSNKDYFDITIDTFKKRLSCENQYNDLFSLKRVLKKAINELKDTFVAIDQYQDLKQGKRLLDTQKKLKTTGFRFTFNYTLKEISQKEASQEKFIWEDDLFQLSITSTDISRLKQLVLEKARGTSKEGESFIFTNYYIEKSITFGRKDIYDRNMLKNGKSIVKDAAKWMIRGILEGWWLAEFKQEKKREDKKKQVEKHTIQKLGKSIVLEGKETMLYTYEDIEIMHKKSQWGTYDIKHYLANFIKVVSLNQYAPKKDQALFEKMGMPIEFI